MARRRFFVHEVRNGQAEISGDEARHLTQVLRVEPGQVFELSDNNGLYLGQIDHARKSQVRFTIIERLPEPPPDIPMHLLVALFKFDRLELLLEKATELGVTTVHFVRAERSDKGLERAAEKRIDRWRRIVTEASQQSRRRKLPQLYEPVRFKEALRIEPGQKLFLDEDRSGASMIEAVKKDTPSIGVMIGPEGGWADHEREGARQAGWTPVSMGEHILRTETAAIAALAVANAVLKR
jgi:16S rRNA (uracil1498-N3)-methyltransferase